MIDIQTAAHAMNNKRVEDESTADGHWGMEVKEYPGFLKFDDNSKRNSLLWRRNYQKLSGLYRGRKKIVRLANNLLSGA